MDTIFKKYIFPFVGAFIVIVVFGIPSSTHAASELKESTNALEKIQKKKAVEKNAINIGQKTIQLLHVQKKQIDSEINKLVDTVEQTKSELKETESNITRIRAGMTEQEQLIAKQRTTLANIIRAQYEHRTVTNNIFSQFFVNNHAEARTDDYITQTGTQITTTLERLAKLRQKLATDHDKLAIEKDNLIDQKNKLVQREQYLESSKNYKQYLVHKTAGDVRKHAKKLSKLEEEEAEIRREIERIELGKLNNVNFADLPSAKKANFRYPVDNPIRITQKYGRTAFARTAYASGFHNGVDFGLGKSSIRAVADGKVIATGNMGRYGYGKWVAVNHKNGLITLYGHFSSIKVKSGKSVDKGDKLGTMGTTGYSTGIHLHFTVFVASSFEIVKSSKVSGLKIPIGASINPMTYL